MKFRNLIATISAAAMTAALLTSSVSAMTAVGNVNVPYGTPTVDGKFSKDEYKSAACVNFSSKTAKAWAGEIPDDFDTDIYVLYDDKGIYFAGEVTDKTLKTSAEGNYDGDGFQISIDMGQYFSTSEESRAIFYSFGLNESKPSVTRQESKNNAVMYDGEGVAIKTWTTDDGWAFELCLEWDTLEEDANLKSGKTFDAKEGFKLNAMFCYINKGDSTSAWGTTLTDESVDYDWGPKDHGVTFTLAAKKAATTAAQTADPVALLLVAASASALALTKRRK